MFITVTHHHTSVLAPARISGFKDTNEIGQMNQMNDINQISDMNETNEIIERLEQRPPRTVLRIKNDPCCRKSIHVLFLN